MARSGRKPKHPDAIDRRALELRRKGLSNAVISERLGFTTDYAGQKALERAITRAEREDVTS